MTFTLKIFIPDEHPKLFAFGRYETVGQVIKKISQIEGRPFHLIIGAPREFLPHLEPSRGSMVEVKLSDPERILYEAIFSTFEGQFSVEYGLNFLSAQPA
jgi:hypothetical protein